MKDPHHDGGTSCADGSEVHCCARTCCIISVEILRGRSIRTNCGFTNNAEPLVPSTPFVNISLVPVGLAVNTKNRGAILFDIVLGLR